jgi:hypothetical protein
LAQSQSKSPRLSGEYLALVAAMNRAAIYIHPRPAGMSPSAFYRKRRAARLKAAKALLSATGS